MGRKIPLFRPNRRTRRCELRGLGVSAAHRSTCSVRSERWGFFSRPARRVQLGDFTEGLHRPTAELFWRAIEMGVQSGRAMEFGRGGGGRRGFGSIGVPAAFSLPLSLGNLSPLSSEGVRHLSPCRGESLD
jgi:hypothetical protein